MHLAEGFTPRLGTGARQADPCPRCGRKGRSLKRQSLWGWEDSVMLRSATRDRSFAADLSQRGYTPVYREHQTNHCPGCGRTNWIVGRVSAECAFCATALPLKEASRRSDTAVHAHNNRPIFFQKSAR